MVLSLKLYQTWLVLFSMLWNYHMIIKKKKKKTFVHQTSLKSSWHKFFLNPLTLGSD